MRGPEASPGSSQGEELMVSSHFPRSRYCFGSPQRSDAFQIREGIRLLPPSSSLPAPRMHGARTVMDNQPQGN